MDRQFHFLWTAKGDWVEIIRVDFRVLDNGLQGYDMSLNPSREVIEKYELEKGEELHPKTGFLLSWFPKTKILQLSEYPQVFFSKLDINGDPTNFHDDCEKEDIIIEDQEREISNLRKALTKAHDDTEEIDLYPEQYAEKSKRISEKFEEVKKEDEFEDFEEREDAL